MIKSSVPKSGWILVASAALFVAGLGTSALSAPRLPDNEVERGLKIAPVRLKLKGLNRTLVGKGSYIINAQGGCNDCHTNPSYADGGNPFLGQPEQINTEHYLAGGQVFGPFTSRNITPDATTGKPAGMTFKEFRKVLRTGHDLNDQLLQVMPWPVYGKMTDKDIEAVYEYLRAIPHAEPGTVTP